MFESARMKIDAKLLNGKLMLKYLNFLIEAAAKRLLIWFWVNFPNLWPFHIQIQVNRNLNFKDIQNTHLIMLARLLEALKKAVKMSRSLKNVKTKCLATDIQRWLISTKYIST